MAIEISVGIVAANFIQTKMTGFIVKIVVFPTAFLASVGVP